VVPPNALLSIGAFASMTRLSIKALRLYDQLNLLQPRHVDPQTGYRFYGIDQLSNARMIRNMREMDMPLATIRQVLALLADSAAEAESLVESYLEIREKQINQIREQVHQFTQLLQQEQKPMSIEVNVKPIGSQQVLSITHHITVDKLAKTIRTSLDTMNAMLEEQGLKAADAPLGIYHGAMNAQENGPIEICLPVNGSVKGKGDVQVRQLQGGDAVGVMMHGAQTDFPAILAGYDAVADWINKNGYDMVGSPREVWHKVGSGPDAKMEIVWLFK
jgi:DNA-binding transcriptional MerR regulator